MVVAPRLQSIQTGAQLYRLVSVLIVKIAPFIVRASQAVLVQEAVSKNVSDVIIAIDLLY